MMKLIPVVAVVVLAVSTLASGARAADIATPAYDWTGFYVGANAGAGFGNSSAKNEFYDSIGGSRFESFTTSVDGEETTFTAGGMLGYNYQIDHIVLGVEADFNYLGFSDSDSGRGDFTQFLGVIDGKTDFSIDWFGTVRGRLGYAIDNVLIYGTGGLAYGRVDASGKVTMRDEGTEVFRGSSDQTNLGWTIGGGMEYGIDNWSLGLEYLYVDLGEDSWHDGPVGEPVAFSLKGNVDAAFSTVRATVKYRFQ